MADKFQNVGFNKVLNEVRYRQIRPYLVGRSCCEVGCGEGQLTKHLVKDFDEVHIVDKERSFLNKIPNSVIKIRQDIEKKWITGFYDTIICSNVLEHLENPEKALRNIYRLGNTFSIFIFVTPNGESFHRQIGVKLGFIKSLLDLTSTERQYGHKRSFSMILLTSLLIKTGFLPIISKTYFYKPYPNKFMEKLPRDVIKNCERIETGLYGAEILVVCKIANPINTTSK